MAFFQHQKIEKEVRKRIRSGESRQQIYDNLLREYDKPQVLASLINAVPSNENIRRYAWVNYILIGLFSAFMGYNGAVIWLHSEGSFQTGWLPFILIIVLLSLWILFHAFRFHYRMYLLMGFLALMNIVHQLQRLQPGDEQELINLFLLFGIASLAIFLRIKLFPFLGWLGPKKDGDGYFIFED